MNRQYDAIIVGARVAGSITATLLGESGHNLLLLDRAHFPSDTLSTHFFRSAALKAFQRYQRVPYGDGWALIGDSGQVFDPWSGQGIDHASQHAIFALCLTARSRSEG